MPVNVAIAGYGRWGKIRARCYANNPNVRLVAVYDIDPKRLEDCDLSLIIKNHDARLYSGLDGLEEMLANEKIDLFNDSTPGPKHKEVTGAALKKGIKYILTEKPMATNIEDVKMLFDMARNMNVMWSIGYTERFDPATLELRELFMNGHIGNIIWMDVKKNGVVAPRARDISVIIDRAIHDIYKMINLHKKKVVRIYGEGRLVISKTEDVASVQLTFEDGVIGTIKADRTYAGREHEFEIHGSRGTCKEIRSDPKWEKHYLEFKRGFVGDVNGLSFKDQDEYFEKYKPSEPIKIEPSNVIEPAYLEIDTLVKSLIYNIPPPISLEEAFEATKIALYAEESCKTHKIIEL